MNRFSFRFALVLVAAIAIHCLLAASHAQAQVPSYYVLQAPAPAPHHGGHGYQPGQARPVTRHGYAYGWFGAQPRQHWSRHFGYYREYTQWSGR